MVGNPYVGGGGRGGEGGWDQPIKVIWNRVYLKAAADDKSKITDFIRLL